MPFENIELDSNLNAILVYLKIMTCKLIENTNLTDKNTAYMCTTAVFYFRGDLTCTCVVFAHNARYLCISVKSILFALLHTVKALMCIL